MAMTRQSSLPLTVLVGLYRLLDPSRLSGALSVHLVGAEDGLEFPPTMVWEEMLHLLPNLRECAVHRPAYARHLLTHA